MSIQDVVTHAQAAILTAATSLKAAPDYPTDVRLAQPTVISYADNLVFRAESAGVYHTFFDLKIDVTVPRGDISQTARFLAGIPKQIADVFRADPTIGGHAQSYAGDVTATWAAGKVNDVDCVGYSFLIKQIKLNE
jgi:hypothetical protein